MSKQSFYNLIWNSKLSDKRATKEFVVDVKDLARRATTAPDGYGILHSVLTGPAFQALYPGVPIVILVHPGQMPIVAAARAQWDHDLKLFDAQEEAIRFLTLTVIDAIPAAIKQNMKDGDNGMSTRSLLWIMQYLINNYAGYLEEDIETLECEYDAFWDPSMDIRTFISGKTHIRRQLFEAGFPINQFHGNRRLKKCFPDSLFRPCWLEHSRAHAALPQWDVDALGQDIIRFADHNLSKTTAAQMGYHAAATVATDEKEDFATMFAAQMELFKSRQLPKFTHYCWSHGPTMNSKHTSALCTNQKPGHKTAATLKNRLDGAKHRLEV